MTLQRKLDMAGKHSTVGKRANRMPDTTVETTLSKKQNLHCCILQLTKTDFIWNPVTCICDGTSHKKC